jgi:sigma-E factor negative regulatory protein RseA
MNAVQTPHQPNGETADSALSALVDGELPPHELDGLLASIENDVAGHDRWNHYQVIGDVLRGSAPASAARAPQAFLEGIRLQLQSEKTQARADSGALTAGGLSVVDRGTAANEAVFRWKMVAGVASLVAVFAVSWTLLDTVTGLDGQGAGSQMAQAGKPVVVETPQGPVLRDPQLEALMAQHRQHGSASALQMPAGFLRNATYDTPAR